MTEEEKKELWSKAQTREAIIERSGTKFNSATDPELALRDAETRLQTGGGLLGKEGGLSFDGILGNKKNEEQNIKTQTNRDLWKNDLKIYNKINKKNKPKTLFKIKPTK